MSCCQAIFPLIVAIGFVVTSPLPASGQEVTLTWKFIAGQSCEVVVQQTSSVETAVDRRVVNHESEMHLWLDWIVESVDEKGAAKMKQVITAVKLSMTMPGGDGQEMIQYDSRAADKPTGSAARVAESFGRLINQPVTLTILPSGEITDVDIPAETMESIRKMPGSMEGRDALSPESLRNMFQQATAVLPDAPIRPGDSWTRQRSFELPPQTFDQTTTYTLSSNSDSEDGHRIQYTSKLNVVKSADQLAALTNLKIDEQSLAGELVFDAENGFCTRSESNSLIKTQAEYRDMKVNTAVTSQLTVQFKRKD